MKSGRVDLRVSRKSGSSASTLLQRSTGVSLRHTRSTSRCDSLSPHTLRKKPNEISASKTDAHAKEATVSVDEAIKESARAAALDRKRRRVDTTEYIKRRFLYDIPEPPKRSRHKPNLTPHSTAALLAISSATLARPKTRSRKVRSVEATSSARQLRQLGHVRRKMGFQHSSTLDPNLVVDTHTLAKKRCFKKYHPSQTKVDLGNSKVRSTWELPDLLGNRDASVSGSDRLSVSQKPSTTHSRKIKCLPSNNRSDELLERLRERTVAPFATPHFLASSGRSVHKKHRDDESAMLNNPVLNRKTEVFDMQSLISHGQSSPDDSQPDDIVNLCSYRRASRFGKFKHPNADSTASDYPHSLDSRDMSEELSQAPNEEVEEEDLLAPELSILTGPTTMAGTGVLLSSLSDSSTMLTSTAAAVTGSRRKSPVRPMQVLRTKSSTSSNVFGNTSDSQFFTEEVLPMVYQQSTVLPHQLRSDASQTGLKGSILRLGTPNGSYSTSITIRPVRDRIAEGVHSDDAKTSLVPSLLNQTVRPAQPSVLSRVFHNANTGRPSSTTPTKAALSTHNTTTSRRRPTILKRCSVAAAAATTTTTIADEENDVSRVSTTRTIGAFTPSALLSHKVSAYIQPSVSGTSPLTSLNVEPSTASTNVGPTKLLQLVTSTSLASSQPMNLTASDKLFGRRPTTHSTKTSLLLQTGHSQYVDTVESRMVVGANVTGGGPYRYAVLRGSADGKRYIVLGNHGVFDRSSIPPVNPSMMTTTTVVDDTIATSSSIPLTTKMLPVDSGIDRLGDIERTDFDTSLRQSSETESLSDISRIQTNFDGITSPVVTPNITSVAAI